MLNHTYYDFLQPFITAMLNGSAPLFNSSITEMQMNGAANTPAWQGLPKFLPGGSLIDGTPWGNMTYNPNAPNDILPDTGVTRSYHFDVAPGVLAPDGYEHEMLLINGQYPGPLIEANWGDWVEITVTNSLDSKHEGTAIHWHGLRQWETSFADGVPGVNQCPIAPAASYTYKFRADHVGSSWYHSHYSAQLASGLMGPIVFYGPEREHFDIDMGPVMISDYYHPYYDTILAMELSNDTSFNHFYDSENNLINGKMHYDCGRVTDGTPCTQNAGISKFQFTPGKDHLMRVVNPSSTGLQFFTIDEHNFTVISNDFIPIESYTTDHLTLAAGQRQDIIVHGKEGADADRAYWIRSNLSVLCTLPSQPYGLAALYYNDEDFATDTRPDSSPGTLVNQEMACMNEPLNKTLPATRIAAPPADKVITVQAQETVNATGHTVWLLNGQTGRVNYNMPALKIADLNNYTTWDPELNVIDTGNHSVVRIVFENQKADPMDVNFWNQTFAHPIHLHGHDFQILSFGSGKWDGTIAVESNPVRRDTAILPPNGHLAIQFTTDNPGVWPIHCHVAWHVSQGFLMTVVERAHELVDKHDVKQALADTCDAWDSWSEWNRVNQIDSGLRMAMPRERRRGSARVRKSTNKA
jgi:FtsP/CotA-like multicopper oxidase with cupredoxin domain